MTAKRAQRLILHAGGTGWSYALAATDGNVLESGSARDTASLPGGHPVTLLVDAASCLGLLVELPGIGGRRLEQALKWAVEEQLAGSAEEEHVVPAGRDARGRVRAAVAGLDSMRRWLAELEPMHAETVLPDALCLPWAEGEIVLAPADDRVLARWDEWRFGSFDADLMPELIGELASGRERLVWYGNESPDWLDVGRVELRPLTGNLPGLLAARAVRPAVNLMSGRFAARSAARARQAWHWAAGLAAAVIVLALAHAAVETRMLQRESRLLDRAIEEKVRSAFPEIGRVVRPREQAERELGRLRFGEHAGVLELLSRVVPVFIGAGGIEVESLVFRDGVIEIGLQAPDIGRLDQLERRLHALDLSAEVQSASVGPEGVAGRIRIRARGS